jgi:hypothetical protein
MKIVYAVMSAVLALGALGALDACAAASPQNHAVGNPAPVDCTPASGALTALEHGSLAMLDSVVQHLTCFDGAQAEAAEEALGTLVATHPKSVFSAFHANKTPEVVIADVAANPPSKYVDDSCGLLRELDRRLVAIQFVHEFARERGVAVRALKEFKVEVGKHCAADE